MARTNKRDNNESEECMERIDTPIGILWSKSDSSFEGDCLRMTSGGIYTLLGKYTPEKQKASIKTKPCTQMLTAALFRTTKNNPTVHQLKNKHREITQGTSFSKEKQIW